MQITSLIDGEVGVKRKNTLGSYDKDGLKKLSDQAYENLIVKEAKDIIISDPRSLVKKIEDLSRSKTIEILNNMQNHLSEKLYAMLSQSINKKIPSTKQQKLEEVKETKKYALLKYCVIQSKGVVSGDSTIERLYSLLNTKNK